MTTVKLLETARSIICTPATWCQGSLAKDSDGYPTDRTHDAAWDRAVQFCAIGALHAADWDVEGYKALAHLNEAAVRLYPAAVTISSNYPAAQVNDKRSHRAVLRIYAEAIRTAKREEKWLQEYLGEPTSLT